MLMGVIAFQYLGQSNFLVVLVVSQSCIPLGRQFLALLLHRFLMELLDLQHGLGFVLSPHFLVLVQRVLLLQHRLRHTWCLIHLLNLRKWSSEFIPIAIKLGRLADVPLPDTGAVYSAVHELLQPFYIQSLCLRQAHSLCKLIRSLAYII